MNTPLAEKEYIDYKQTRMWVMAGSLVLIVAYTRWFLPFQEQRSDLIPINDRIIGYLPNRDMSHWIFPMMLVVPIMTSTELFIVHDFYAVELLVLKYALAMVAKIISLYTLPLETPDDYIPLADMVSRMITCDLASLNGDSYGRDLFFSGHTVLLYLCWISAGPVSQAPATVALWVVPVLLLVNRAHYTIDILVAPLVGWACHSVVTSLLA